MLTQEEERILGGMLPEMGRVFNAVPGEAFRSGDGKALAILAGRMEPCDLKTQLELFCEIYAHAEETDLSVITGSMAAYMRISALLSEDRCDFDDVSTRSLIRDCKKQISRLSGVIRLSKANEESADGLQKEKIRQTISKNEAFIRCLESEMETAEKETERKPEKPEAHSTENIPAQQNIPIPAAGEAASATEEEPKEKDQDEMDEDPARESEEIQPAPKRLSLSDRIGSAVNLLGSRKKLDAKMKEEEKKDSETICKEIPFYDRTLPFTEKISCCDFKEYCIFKRRGSVYFGLSENAAKSTYDNSDGSLLELTEADDEFVQLMRDGWYDNPVYTDSLRQGILKYFDFVTRCFEKHLGQTLSVREYLQFKTHYNQLVLKMADSEQKNKKQYCRALPLAYSFLTYAAFYMHPCADDENTAAHRIMENTAGEYADCIEEIIAEHITDDGARKALEELRDRIISFHAEETETPPEQKEPEARTEKKADYGCAVPYGMPYMACQTPVMPAFDQGGMQIVIQILDEDRHMVDEAVYAPENISQALADYETRPAYIKRLGFKNNGQIMFCREDRETDTGKGGKEKHAD